MTGIQVAWEDVFSVLAMIRGHLIGIAAGLVILIAVLIAAKRAGKPKKGLIRKQAVLAFVLFLVLMVNSICLGALNNTLAVVFADTGEIRPETALASRETVQELAEEGIVLLKNEDGALPLSDVTHLNVFGWASTNPIYGGTGSGSVDVSTAVDILGGLTNAGFTLNTELTQLYTQYRTDRPEISINNGQDWTLPEVPVKQYSREIIDNAKAFSDTALIVIARCGGEGADLPHDMGAVMDGSWQAPGTKYLRASYTNNSDEYDDFTDGMTYLELSRTEADLVDLVCSNFDKVIVVYNGANPLEMGWINDYEQIKGLLVCPGAGSTGFNGLGTILKGEVNPSGKTADTWVYDLTATPYYKNIGHFGYTNVEDITGPAKEHWEKADGVVSFVNYVEDIYVGYRFYETAAAEGLIDYEKTVQFPFGYGLSYTTFSHSMGDLKADANGNISVDVTVTNTGDKAGKEVVELYYNPPYTNGGLEKASANLAAFDKTSLLKPGASETLTLTFHREDMASYDAQDNGCYVLEAGDYIISLNRDSHTVVDSRVYSQDETIVYDIENPRTNDQVPAVNQFDFAKGEVTYLSRENGFANYEQAVEAPADYELHETVTAHGTWNPEDYNQAEDVMPTTGAKNGLELYDLRGASYEDPRWDSLLDQLTVDDMVNLIAFGGYGSVRVDSVGKAAALDADGPAGINANVSGSGNTRGTGYTSEIVIACTWNTDLALAAGRGLCAEAKELKVNGWYAPSMNLHRSAFEGRMFEYYSEDPVLSAEMAKAECQGAYEFDIYPFIKHFALNEQEINRNGILCTWVTEQAMRELYLKPFEACVKDAGDNALAVMSSYNLIGNKWAGACTELLNTVLREEWGFRGMVLTDYFGNYGYMDADKAVRGGSDMMLGTAGNDAIMTDTSSATSVKAMRQAAKNIFYTVVNSGLYADYDPDAVPAWHMVFYVVDGVILVALALLEVLTVRSYMKKKKEGTE